MRIGARPTVQVAALTKGGTVPHGWQTKNDTLVKGQVRDAERNLRSYFRVAIIRAVSKPRP
jgi:hypothetical protein